MKVLERGDRIFDKDYEKRVKYVIDPANQTFRCPYCNKMNLPEAQYCSHCAGAIGDQAIERIRKRKMDFVMLGMEMDLGILDDCFQVVLKKMLQDERFMMRPPTTQGQEKNGDTHQTNEPQPKKRGRKPKTG